jgi:PAS domain-containing protein
MGSELATMASANMRLQQEIEGRKKPKKELARLNHDLMGTNKALDEERSLLQASEIRFRLLVNEALDAIFLADASGKFVMVNQQACACLGYNEQELLALSTEDIEVGHTDEEILHIFKDLSQEGARKELILHLYIFDYTPLQRRR